MKPESIVYGCIKDMPFGTNEQTRARRTANLEALLTLPNNEDWPFLCQEMFSTPGDKMFNGTYQTQVIHFGASYKAIEYEWEVWIAKFEDLLRRMYWVNATVHLETELSGTHTFNWEATGMYHEPNSGELKVRCEWEHTGAIRTMGM